MIEQIQKFSKGGGTSRQQLNASKGRFEAAYETASDEARQKASALIQSASNYTSANPTVGRNNRLNQAQVYDEATRILRGEGQSQAPSIDNGWGNKVINDFYAINKNRAQKTTPSQSAGQFTKYGSYDSNYFGLTDDSWDLNARVNALAENIMTSLDNAKASIDSGVRIPGWSLEKINNLQTYLGNAITNHANDPRGLQAEILRKAKDFGITDKASWDEYFGETDDLSQAEKNLQALKGRGYTDYDMSGYSQWVNATAKDKKLRFMKDKDGNLRVFNDDYSDYTGGALSLYNDDWTAAPGTGYGDVLLIGADGNIHMGAIGNLDQNSSLYNQYTKQLAATRAERDKLFSTHKYNGMFSDAGDNGELFEALSDRFGRSFNGADVSGLFSGSDKVFAIQGNGKGEMKADEYGNLRFDGNTRFYSLDDNGQLVEKTWDEMKGLYNRRGFGETENQMGALTDLSHDIRKAETSITGDEDLMGRNYWDQFKTGSFLTSLLTGTRGIPHLLGLQYAAWDDIKDDPTTFVKLVLDATANVDGKISNKYRITGASGVKTNKELLANLDWTNKSKDYTVYMFKYLQQHPEVYNSLSPEQKNQWKELLRRYNGTDTIVEKNGGIIKAAKGTVLTGAGEDITSEESRYKGTKEKSKQKYDELRKREQKATERGFDSIYAMDANDTEAFGGDVQMTTSDIMRLTTMAQDVASIVASFVPGAGTAVAAGLGVTSTATDLAADILDPAVSTGEVVKNLAVNAGMSLVGMIPGAKMGKVAKNVIKWAPRLMTIAAGAGLAMDESTQQTFKKIGDGSTNFTREDWKNISRVLQVASGAVRTGKGMYDSHKVNKAIVSGENVTLKGVKSTTADGDLQLPKKTVDEINTKLSKAKTEDEAKAILKELKNESNTPIFANDEQIEAALKTPVISGDKVKVGKYKLVGTKDAIDADKSYNNLRSIWNEEEAVLKKQSETTLGKAAILFGNKFGGGAYGAKQRAILGDPGFKDQNPFADKLGYEGWYNPMVDWKGLRNQAGMRIAPERVVNPSSTSESSNLPITLNPTSGGAKRSGEITGLAVTDQNPGYSRRMRDMLAAKRPRLQKPYDGTDGVVDGIHVNPVRNEAPIKGIDEVRRVAPKVELSQKPLSEFTGRDFTKALTDPNVFFKVKEGLAGEIKELKKLEKTIKSISQQVAIKGRIAMLQEWQKRFKAAVPPYIVDATGQTILPFKLGGQIQSKFSHLRK